MRKLGVAGAATCLLVLPSCDYLPTGVGGYTYRAEVGYREGGQEQWFVGDDKSYQACVEEAQRRYNAMNAVNWYNKDPNHAFSWACRKMQGERFLERVR